MSMFAKSQAEDREFTPETGYNVVGVDAYAHPGDGESLYLIAHCETWAGAQAVAGRYRAPDADRVIILPRGIRATSDLPEA